MNSKYEDMIYLPHPISTRRAGMSVRDRAAQFAPFAALTGFEAVTAETARLTVPAPELSEGVIEKINEKLYSLWQRQQQQPVVTVTWFQPDVRKSGGRYVTQQGQVKRIEQHTQRLILTDGTEIPLAQICKIK